MDLNAIVIFVNVVQEGSFVGAARALEIPKSTISRKLAQLEEHLGVRLIQRNTRRITLTADGDAFLEHAQKIARDVSAAEAAVNASHDTPRGKLRVTTDVLLGESFIGAWASDYLGLHPGVELELCLLSRKVDLIAEGFDLAIRVGAMESTSHIGRKLALAPHFLVASPDYLAEHGSPEVTEDLREHKFVNFSPDRRVHPLLLTSESEDTYTLQPRGQVIVNSWPVARDACLSGLGIASLPVLACCEDLRSGALVRVLPEWSEPDRWVHALYPSRQHLAATVRTFLDFVSERLSPAPWLEAPTERNL